MMQTQIEEVSINKYVDYALRLRKQIDYLVGDNVGSSIKNQVVNTIWDKSLSPKIYYKPEIKETASNPKANTEKIGNRDEDVSTIKRLIVKNKDNMPILQAYSDFSRNRKVEEMTSEERKMAIKILGGN